MKRITIVFALIAAMLPTSALSEPSCPAPKVALRAGTYSAGGTWCKLSVTDAGDEVYVSFVTHECRMEPGARFTCAVENGVRRCQSAGPGWTGHKMIVSDDRSFAMVRNDGRTIVFSHRRRSCEDEESLSDSGDTLPLSP
jgi:hypothetical protein